MSNEKDFSRQKINRRNFLFSLAGALASIPAFHHLAICQQQPKSQEPKTVDYSSVVNRFRERLPALMTQYNVPGVAIALVDRDRLVWSEGFGDTDKTKQIKVTDETLFSVQSISKTYTAMGVLAAINKGLLKLDDSVRKHIPKFTVKSRFGADETGKITIRHLLSHWAGLCHEAPVGSNFDNCNCTFEEHINSIPDTWLVSPVGKRFSYSNLGIDLTGYILQLRSRIPFEKFLYNEVFNPLEMTSSTFSQKEAKENPSFAKGHRGEDELPVYTIPMIPAGGMYSSVKDMAKFLSFHLRGGTVKGKHLISERLLKEMLAPQFAVDGQIGGYGIGVYNTTAFNSTRFLHSGGGYGYSADQRWMPEYGIGAVALMNQQRGLSASALTNSALELMIKAKYGDIPQAKPTNSVSRPIITVAPELLRRLEGTYKGDGLVTFKIEDEQLFRLVGNEKQKLEAYSSTEFKSDRRKYTFDLDEKGKPKGVRVIDPNYSGNGVEYWMINETPTDEPGANRQEWSGYIGQYTGMLYGSPTETNVFVKNGHLYTGWQGGLKLNEYKPGLFFSTDGEAVIFQNGQMTIGNRRFVKK